MSAVVIEAIDEALGELVPLVGARTACAAVGVPRASYYRDRPGQGPDDGDLGEGAGLPLPDPPTGVQDPALPPISAQPRGR